jgi:hypothetical protein
MKSARLRFLLLAVVASPALSQPAAPQLQLGRLFLTPESRTYLERQRLHDIKETRSLEGESMRLDGIVTRSSGKSTVWVNNRPQHEKDVGTGVGVTALPRQPGKARLSVGDEPPADLKVGVTINRATRETEGGLTDGAIRVIPSAGK